MIRGKIAIPDKDPKSWRSRGRKKRKQPAIASAIVTPVPLKKRLKGPVTRLDVDVRSDETTTQLRRGSAIVESKPRPKNAMLLEEITDEERNRRADLANEMFREIKRQVAAKNG
jgi:hypothetical protein